MTDQALDQRGVELGRRIRDARIAAGLDQLELVMSVGREHISVTTLGRLERGLGLRTSMETLIRIALALGVDAAELVGDRSHLTPQDPPVTEKSRSRRTSGEPRTSWSDDPRVPAGQRRRARAEAAA